MKKLLLLVTIAAFSIATVNAQIERPTKTVKRVTVTQTNNTPSATVYYYLCSANVEIHTGNDNKELPSNVTIYLNRLSRSRYSSDPADNTTLLYSYLIQGYQQLEFKPNSISQVALKNLYSFPYTFPGGSYEGWRYNELELGSIQSSGLLLTISYSPNFFLDAWKIEKVIVKLEFKDLNGNPHPTMATVTIPFLNASTLLKNGNDMLRCEIDKFLMPKN